MKNFNYLLFSILFLFVISVNEGCKKSETDINNPSLPQLSTFNTTDVGLITETTASITASVSSEGGSAITAKGICWSTNHNPTIADNKTSNRHSGSITTNHTTNGTGGTSFTALLTGLTSQTTHYARVYATNSFGTGYSNEVSFTTAGSDTTVMDIEGNIYNVVVIGTQTWMKENLKTTKYNDGTNIPYVPDSAQWSVLATPGYCYYDNNQANQTVYGNFYNWYAINTGKLAPAGWHVPTAAELLTMSNYLGGDSISGAKLKAISPLWTSNATNNNISGFTGLPSGYRFNNGTYTSIRLAGGWYGSDQYDAAKGQGCSVLNTFINLFRGRESKKSGYAVRCVKD